MRVLFVDDEEKVLQGIQRSLFEMDNWEIQVATSGEEALEILSDDKYDVVVTDMRMPRMDGAKLLQRIQTDYPTTVRIVLSGHAEEEAAMRAVGVAHQFLSKPCAPEDLRKTIQSTFDLQRLLDSEEVQRLVGSIPTLPVVPAIYSELNRLLIDPEVSLNAVSKVVEKDPAMCAKLLQLVNSSFFANRYPTTDVHAAVVRLGAGTLKTLVLSLEAMDQLKPKKQLKCFSYGEQTEHAQHVARAVVAFFDKRAEQMQAFMAGMLHDIGKWVLASTAPDLFESAWEKAQAEGVPLHVAEYALYGATHAELGAYLLGLWGIPTPVVAAVAYHHAPGRAESEQHGFSLVNALYVTNEASHGRVLDAGELAELSCPFGVEEVKHRLGAEVVT